MALKPNRFSSDAGSAAPARAAAPVAQQRSTLSKPAAAAPPARHLKRAAMRRGVAVVAGSNATASPREEGWRGMCEKTIADAASGEKIEITPEMIDAGFEAAALYDRDDPKEWEITGIHRAIETVRRKSAMVKGHHWEKLDDLLPDDLPLRGSFGMKGYDKNL